jgi:hypothetical protein
MLADDIQAGFPDGVAVPAELRRLCEYADANGREVSGNFEFETDGRGWALAWFDGDEIAASRFAVFGRGPDGSLYALWLHAGPDASRAPVVLLDSEATDNQVVAADVRDFLRLLAIGYSEPGRYPTLEPDDPESAEELREWVSEEFGLEVPANAAELVAAAQARHPDLDAWVREWQERRGT